MKTYDGPVSDHFDGLRFFPPGGPKDKNLRDIARWAREARRRVAWPKDLPPVVPDVQLQNPIDPRGAGDPANAPQP